MTLDKNNLKGIFPALVTPTDEDGNVDKVKTRRLVNTFIEAGCKGLLPVGGTGEYTSLSPLDRVTSVETVVEETAGRVPVIAGVLSAGFKEALNAGMDFKKAGADALMLVTPHYAKPLQEGIRKYFCDFVLKIDMPVIIYDNPVRTGVTLEPRTIEKIVDENEMIIGFKASSPDPAHFLKTMSLVGDKISILSGDEYLFVWQLMMGAQGGFPAIVNVFPQPWVEIFEKVQKGDIGGAFKTHTQLIPLIEAIYAETFPSLLKEAMGMVGMDVGHVLSPLERPSAENMKRLKKVVKDFSMNNSNNVLRAIN